ncbi:MAG: hypothetical protein WC223_11860 [Bacteroidales bacterium]|jgi:hypothetical protein
MKTKILILTAFFMIAICNLLKAQTPNYIPKFITGGTTNSNIFQDLTTGRIGIGTITPTSMLHLYGTAGNTYPCITIERNDAQLTGFGGDLRFVSTNTPHNSSTYFGSVLFQGKVLGTAYTGAQITAFAMNQWDASNQNSRIEFMTTNGTTLSTKMTILHDGNVGIGTTTPVAKLEVNGDVAIGVNCNYRITRATGGVVKILGISSGNTFIYSPWTTSGLINFANNNGQEKMTINTDNGNVGIGTTSPQTTLSVSSASEDLLHLSRTTANAEDNVFLAFSHNNNTASLNARAKIGLSVKSGGAGRLVFYTGTAGSLTEKMRIGESGNVGIGTTNNTVGEQTFKLAVNGSIVCKEVKVVTDVPASDYVFEKNYKLRSLSEIENFVNKNKHLPEVPSAEEFKKNGYKVGEMDDMLLRKIEELTLYMIDLKKENENLKQRVANIENK